MKYLARNLCIAALLPLTVLAAARDDYVQQWPLALGDADAGAYRVTLDRSVYRQLQSPQLKDLVVVNAEGNPVSASLFDAEQPLAKAASATEVPWFALPASSTSQSRDIASISEIAADGTLRRVVMNDAGPGDTEETSSNEYLIDTSRLRAPVQALKIGWAAGQAPFDRPYRVAASDDLKDWRTVQDESRLVELENNGARILKDRIELGGVQARYLRLVPLQKDQRVLALASVRAEFVATTTQAWQWEDIAGKRIVGKDGAVAFVYESTGRFPFERADVMLPGNSSNEWTLASRDGEDLEWQTSAAPWMAFQLGGSAASRSPPQALHQLNRDHHWRLQSQNAVEGEVPVLRLGYRPEVVVFLAQGTAPYALLAGSARAQRADAPLAQLVDALRAQRGQDWQPATATLGSGSPLADARTALTPAPAQRDWKAWLLWALLIGGALVVSWFAFSLMRKPGGTQD